MIDVCRHATTLLIKTILYHLHHRLTILSPLSTTIIMKLSTAVTFLGSAAATFPGASAERVVSLSWSSCLFCCSRCFGPRVCCHYVWVIMGRRTIYVIFVPAICMISLYHIFLTTCTFFFSLAMSHSCSPPPDAFSPLLPVTLSCYSLRRRPSGVSFTTRQSSCRTRPTVLALAIATMAMALP